MRINKLKKMFKKGEPIVNGWLQIPSPFSAEVMAHQGWDSCTIDMQHGVIDYQNALKIFRGGNYNNAIVQFSEMLKQYRDT